MQTLLLKQALIGTGKAIPDNSLEALDGQIELVESVCAELKTESPEWKLLLRAGCYSVAERVGFVPDKVAAEDDKIDIQPAAAINVTKNIAESELKENRPEISRPLTDCLEQFMKQFAQTPQVIAHLLKRIDSARLRLRVETLPDFLNVFAQRKLFKDELREIIVSIIGEQGQWLAAQNKDWQWASCKLADKREFDLSAAENIWNEGTFSDRKSALEIICQHDSAKAKKLLAETWKSEKAEQRSAFLEIVSSYFDNADVQFLDGILRDRSVVIRQTAANCLARFPESDFAQRMCGLADQIIVTKKISGSDTLQIVPPVAFTKQMKEDGLEEKPPRGIGEKSWLVYEILKFLPFSYWEQRFQMKASELVGVLLRDEYFQSVLYAWTYAAQKFSEGDQWLDSIWDAWEIFNQKRDSDLLNIQDTFVRYALKKSPMKFMKKLQSGKRGSELTNYSYYIREIWLGLYQNMSGEVEEFFVTNICEYFERAHVTVDWLSEFIPFVPPQHRYKIKNLLQQNKIQNEKSNFRRTTSADESTLELCEQFDRLLDLQTDQQTKS
ncbi:MAG: DUF5691 domain-containing protein [Planctomycetaceae bacterium]|nr:DUF5691 domain-containing protein [Planctomycetaceae bacterium]